VREPGGPRRRIDLGSGAPAAPVSAQEAGTVAAAFARRLGLPGPVAGSLIRRDQWTLSGEFDPDRPLYRFSFGDAGGTELYVSSTSGRAVQLTTAQARFWNRLGSVPHWLYFAPLRSHPYLWTQVVIYSSLIGCFLTVTGLYIGVRQYLRRPPRQISPYRGYMLWHHVPGLVFGVFLLTWVASGLFSMNPWGFLDGGDATSESAELAGSPLRWGEVEAALAASAQRSGAAPAADHPIAPAAPSAAYVSLRSAPFDGRLYFIATTAAGVRIRLDATGMPAPLAPSELTLAGRLLGAAQAPQLLRSGDAFYFTHHSEPVSLPVYRLVLRAPGSTRYYLDPVSGEILREIDRSARGYRWLHQGLHRLDFTTGMRTRPFRDVLMAFLLAGATVVSATGLYSAVLRVARGCL